MLVQIQGICMQKNTDIKSLIEEWKNLRSNGWKLAVDTKRLLEIHADLEEEISKVNPTNKSEAFRQLEFLYTL